MEESQLQATGLDERRAWDEVLAKPRADGKTSLLGVVDTPAVLAGDATPDAPPMDGKTYFTEVDGKLVFTRDGVVVGESLTPAKEKEAKADAAAERDLSDWQRLQKKQRDKARGAIEFPVDDVTWYFARPSMRQIRLLDALKTKIKINEDGTPQDLDEWLEPVCKSLFRLLLVKGKHDYRPFFDSDEEAEEFICDPEFGDTCLVLFNAIREVYEDFLGAAQAVSD